MEWNGNFGMEYGRCQNGMEDFKNGMEDYLPYQFHTRFCTLYLQKDTYRCRVVIKYCHKRFLLQYLRILFVDKLRYFGSVHCTNSVRIASLLVHCNLIAALMLQLTTFIDLTCFF